ncbi:hypothetical protein JYU19_01505 [bacterium AH-315-J21]|nr:hypothetical protein [bacterium AH-315-J21]
MAQTRLRCPKCKFIGSGSSPDGKTKPCQNCNYVYSGGAGMSWGMWPFQNILNLIDELDRLSLLESRFRSAELILYCSMIEGLLVNLLQEINELRERDNILSAKDFERANGLGGKLKLFKKLTGIELRVALSELECADWYSNIFAETDVSHTRGLYLKRKDCIHGPTTLKYDSSALDRISESRRKCLAVFESLNNWAVMRVSARVE